MPSVNKVILIGNVTRDPEIKYTPKGTAVTEVGLAINRVTKTDSGEKREEVTFVGVTLWGRQAEIVGEYVKKGSPLYVEGRLAQESWEDKQTGQTRTKTKVIGENVQLLGQKRDGGAPARESRPSGASRQPAPQPEDDDIPFN